jgi:hypothetical protein
LDQKPCHRAASTPSSTQIRKRCCSWL